MADPDNAGFLAVTCDPTTLDILPRMVAGMDQPDNVTGPPGMKAVSWGGVPALVAGQSEAVVLSATVRRRESDQDADQVQDLLTAADRTGLSEMLPTFAAACWVGPDSVVAVSDALGFRHLYRAHGPGWAAVSTSTLPLAKALRSELDDEALAVQSQLGWQVGQRTLQSGVEKLAIGSTLTLAGGVARADRTQPEQDPSPLAAGPAVDAASRLLRGYLDAYLDDHPDAILQLTGGLDSRILLSAIAPSRRKGLRTMTLAVPGVQDLEIAQAIAGRYGMRHEVLTLDGLELLDDHQAYELCLDAARLLNGNADPLAYASLAFAEARSEDGPRLSGLGGEVTRGFYYTGRDVAAVTTARRAARLTTWRMFVNERVSGEALVPEFAAWAQEFAREEILRVLRDTGKPWLAATDELYLAHRMQRWAGVTETAVCLTRPVVNPMLDDRFLAIAARVSPNDKRNARFLSRIQVALDPDLAALPLDDRPPPVAYTRPSLANSLRTSYSHANKFRRKVRQRLLHANRPPVGAEVLSSKVVAHWRANPSLLDRLRPLGIFQEPWLNDLGQQGSAPPTSTVAFMLNIVAATESRTKASDPTGVRPR